jgi:rhomboid protease GluP
MNLQLFVTVNIVAISILLMLIALIQRPGGYVSWAAANFVVVVISALALFFGWAWPGAIAGALFAPLILAPAVCSRLVYRRALTHRLREAAFYSSLGAFFHPAPRTRFNAALMGALALGDPDRIILALDKLASGSTFRQRSLARAFIAMAQDDWPAVLALIGGEGAGSDVAWLEIRALGETGAIDDMAAAYTRLKPKLAGANLTFCQLYVLAFSGRPLAAEALLNLRLPSLHGEARTYWSAIAAISSSGEASAAAARQSLAGLARNAAQLGLRLAASRHLTAGSGGLPRYSPETAKVIAQIETQAVRDAAIGRPKLQRCPITIALIITNLAVFGLELWAGGSENVQVLVELGALWPPLVIERSEWWRLMTAPFLHAGWLHLAANMLMLGLLGSWAETAFGRRTMLFAYLLGGAVSSLCVLGLMWSGHLPDGVLVGASGAIFTIFGLIAARHIRQWIQSRDLIDRRRVTLLAIVLLVQFTIDLSIPQISFTAHASGLALGLAIGWLSKPGRSWQPVRT